MACCSNLKEKFANFKEKFGKAKKWLEELKDFVKKDETQKATPAKLTN